MGIFPIFLFHMFLIQLFFPWLVQPRFRIIFIYQFIIPLPLTENSASLDSIPVGDRLTELKPKRKPVFFGFKTENRRSQNRPNRKPGPKILKSVACDKFIWAKKMDKETTLELEQRVMNRRWWVGRDEECRWWVGRDVFDQSVLINDTWKIHTLEKTLLPF